MNCDYGCQEQQERYVNNKRKTKDNMGLLANEGWALITEALNAFFALVFTDKTSHQETLTWEPRVKKWWKTFPWLERAGLEDIPKSMSPDRMHPWVLRELADTILGHSSSSLCQSGEVCKGLEESKCHLSLQKWQEGEPKELLAIQLHLRHWKGKEF